MIKVEKINDDFKFEALYDNTTKAEDILEQYNVDQATVYITKNGKYIVQEPMLSKDAYDILQKMMPGIQADFPVDVSESSKLEIIRKAIEIESRSTNKNNILRAEWKKIQYALKRDLVEYGKLSVLMKDTNLEDIVCSQYKQNIAVSHKEFSQFVFLNTNIKFNTHTELNDLLRSIMQEMSISPSLVNPIIYTRTANAHRLTVGWDKTISQKGTFFYIRKFPEKPYTIVDLLMQGTLNEIIIAYIWMMHDSDAFYMIAGNVGTGKTTLLNTLLCVSNPTMHVITIEDSQELQVPHKLTENYTTKTAITGNKSTEITMSDLFKLSLRAIPTLTIVGEVRGIEAKLVFQYGPSGHGHIFTFHEESSESGLRRLTQDQFGVSPNQLADLWFVVHTRNILKNNKKNRRITNIDEIVSKSGDITTKSVFTYNQLKDRHSPDNIEELIENSANISRATKVLGIQDVYSDLEKRIKFIRKCVSLKADTPAKILSTIAPFYKFEI